MVKKFNIILLLLLSKLIFSKIEDLSVIIPFEIKNQIEDELINNMIIDYHSTFNFPYNIAIIDEFLTINYESSIALISTNLSDSIFISKNTIGNSKSCSKGYSKLKILNSQFDFEGCGPYTLDVILDSINLSHLFYQIIETKKSNSIKSYNSIIALSSFTDSSMVTIDYIDKQIKIIKGSLNNNDEQIFNQSIKNMIKCDPLGIPFACKINYILFGTEGEKDEPFLAKKIEEKDSIAYFDNLSSYSIFPYEYLNYFLTSFFSKYNDECIENKIKNTFLYYITCSRKNIEICSYARNMSIIINNYAFPLKNLFNDSFKLLNLTSPHLIYFNILFNKSSVDFIFGTNFFIGKQIGYNFLDNSTYIYSNDYIDFTSNFSGENSATFQFLLYALTFGLFTALLIVSTMMNWIHTRQINKELKNIIKS